MQNDLHGVQMLPLQTTIYIANNFYRNKTLLDTTDWGPDLKKNSLLVLSVFPPFESNVSDCHDYYAWILYLWRFSFLFVDDGDLVKMQGVQNFRRSLSFLHFTNSDFNIYAYDYLCLVGFFLQSVQQVVMVIFFFFFKWQF